MINLKNLNQTATIDFDAGETILINKPTGWSSFDVVNKIKKALKIKKIGHSGTLDPFADGLLILVTGKKTKEAGRFQNLPKTYVGTIALGQTTDTLDTEGEITERKPVPPLTSEKIAALLSRFLGESLQTPPVYSALKLNGRRAYKLARENRDVELAPRKIHIYALELLDFSKAELTIRVHCSKGTYVRALARDIAKSLGTVGFLKSLTRTEIGPFSLEEALEVDAFIDTVKRKQRATAAKQ